MALVASAVRALSAGGKRVNFSPMSCSARGLVSSSSVQKVDVKQWTTSAQFGVERNLLIHVLNNSNPGDSNAVLSAMNSFWDKEYRSEGGDSWAHREEALERVITEKQPERCLEIGTYCGATAIRIAKNLPEGGKLVSVEADPLYAAIATKLIEHAGLAASVKVLMGTMQQRVSCIQPYFGDLPGERPLDFVFCDHSKEQYVPDLKLLETEGAVGPGTVVMADTKVYPGERTGHVREQDLIGFFEKHPSVQVQKDSDIVVSEWCHLP